MAYNGFDSSNRFTVPKQYGGLANFSVSVSVLPGPSVGTSGTVVGVWGDPAGVDQFLIKRDTNNQFLFALVSGDSNYHVFHTNEHYNAGQWNHVALVFSPTGVLGYLNGVYKNSSGGVAGVLRDRSGYPFGVGARSLGTEPVDGSIAELAIWRRALTAAEVAGLSKGIRATHYPAQLDFYSPMVRTMQDLNGTPITQVGAPTVTNHPRIYP